MNSFTRFVSLSRGFQSLARQNGTKLARSGQTRSMSSGTEEKKGGFNYLVIVAGVAAFLYLGSLFSSALSLKNSIIETGHDRKAALRHD